MKSSVGSKEGHDWAELPKTYGARSKLSFHVVKLLASGGSLSDYTHLVLCKVFDCLQDRAECIASPFTQSLRRHGYTVPPVKRC